MTNRYTVVDEFVVKDSKILVLDSDRAFEDYNTSKIEVDGKPYKYGLTHNARWIIVKTDTELIGKELYFVS